MKKYKVSKCQLIECLSTALELVNPAVAGHNKRVAMLSKEMARVMGLPPAEVDDVYYAALLHDIGAAPLSISEKDDLITFDMLNPYKHCLIGAQLLLNYPPFEKIAEIVHYHHASWMRGQNLTSDGRSIPIGSFIIHLADRVDILVNQNKHILTQKKRIVDQIKSMSGEIFMPEAVAALDVLYDNESFWLSSLQGSHQAMEYCRPFQAEYITQEELVQFSRLISLVIDFKSRFTASHSCGVSAVAGKLAEAFGLDHEDCMELSIAGNLHDLGKLAVPNEILEKNGRLDEDEDAYIKSHSYFTYSILSQIDDLNNIATYAAQHHEKVDGSGYPFHIAGDDLSINSRLLAVADVFTALAEDRPYRKGLEKEDILRIMQEMVEDGHLESSLVMLAGREFETVNALRCEIQQKTQMQYKHFWKDINMMLGSHKVSVGTVL